jgi:integrase
MKTAKARFGLTPRGKPYFTPTVTPGISLGYRRIADRAGSWIARVADGQSGSRQEVIGVADDLDAANGKDVLSYTQAQDKARTITRSEPTDRVTLAAALDEYENSRDKVRDPGNVRRIRNHIAAIAPALMTTDVAALTLRDLERFRDAIAAKPQTVNRTLKPLWAALTRAAKRYPEQIASMNAWKNLEPLPFEHVANNVVLSDDEVRAIVRAAYEYDPALGLLVEVGAMTGARPKQIARLQCRDLLGDRTNNPRLHMPTSNKGNCKHKKTHVNVPITADLAAKLRSNRGPSEPLLLRSDGEPWSHTNPHNEYQRQFQAIVARAGIANPRKVTFYALRHSSITRQINARTPLHIIAARHDTSERMIVQHYGRDIDEHDDGMRAGLIDLAAPARANVIALAR